MIYPEGPERAIYVREMFGNISNRYDLMNRLMTFGRDRSWRRYVVHMVRLQPGNLLLDVGTGTGDIALEAKRVEPSSVVIGVDFSFRMMQAGRRRSGSRMMVFCSADAFQLPFPDGIFDAVTSGYLVRNVSDVRQVFEEQIRVVKPGGHVVCLDTSPRPNKITWPFILFHLKVIIPFLGYLFTNNKSAYKYLRESTRAFMKPDELALVMNNVGLQNVSYRRLMFGTQVVHSGMRPKV
ncbi:MAG TPA: hypothetical protein DDW42_09735 [Desulfobacteraceae bacterium]|nr:hypothetical protein [Desulfobacteraceae bacterium]